MKRSVSPHSHPRRSRGVCPARPPPPSNAMSPKVVAIAAGEAHTLVLTANGAVYSWGRGTFGRLGTGKEEDELFPVPVAFPSTSSSDSTEDGEKKPPRFTGITAGAYHSLALDEDGSVWSWGYNIYGQLGHGEENSSIPCLVEGFQELGSPDSLAEESKMDEKKHLKVCSVKAGGMMSLAIDSLGALWIWGNCPQQSKTDEGVFCLSSSSSPLPVWDFHGHTVVKVACGNEHVVAAISGGETYTGGHLICYAWGNNNHGQLGLGDKESRPCPEVISTFNLDSPWTVYEIACGAYHTAILTHERSSDREAGSKCWTFGLGDNGQLGHGTTISTSLPEPVNGLPEDVHLISLDCGLFHTSVVSATGDVWSWGMEKGLGLCPDASFTGSDAGDALSPLRIQSGEANGFRFPGAVQVACGAAHTVLVAGDGDKLWAWGRGRSGVLGRGQTADSFAPCVVMWPPLDKDFKQENVETSDGGMKARNLEGEDIVEIDQKLSATIEEVNFLRKKLAVVEQYATVLHVSIFRKPFDSRNLPQSLQDSDVFDIRKELDNMMESADSEELARMEMFYKNMLATVKDKLLKRRIQEIVKDCLLSLSTRRQSYPNL